MVSIYVNQVCTVVLGVVLGTLYYYNMSLSIPKDSNCSFSANIWTDIFAFIIGVLLIIVGLRISPWESYVVLACGTAIIVEHVWQLVHNKI